MASKKLETRRKWCFAIGVPFALAAVGLNFVRLESQAANEMKWIIQFLCVVVIIVLVLFSYPHPLRNLTRGLAAEREKTFREHRRKKHKK
ncbi:MAG: hypothetical protein JXP34_09730 [Planctomycetes bacterium]|nr:hypothetical protein [Planctomycetota bacterium]